MSRRSTAIAITIAVMVVWGTTYIVTKYAVDEVPPMLMTLMRFLFAIAVLLPFALARGGLLAPLPKPRPLGALIMMGITGFAVYYSAFNAAFVYISAAQGALIQSLLPAGIATAAVFVLREKISARRMLGVVLSVIGVALVVLADTTTSTASPNPLLGSALMAVTVLAWAAYTVFAKRLAHIDPIVVTVWAAAIGSIMLVPFVAYELAHRPQLSIGVGSWLALAFLGIGATGFGLLGYSRALRDMDASVMGVYVNLVPLIGVLSAVVFLGETLEPWQMVGGIIALIGMWLAS